MKLLIIILLFYVNSIYACISTVAVPYIDFTLVEGLTVKDRVYFIDKDNKTIDDFIVERIVDLKTKRSLNGVFVKRGHWLIYSGMASKNSNNNEPIYDLTLKSLTRRNVHIRISINKLSPKGKNPRIKAKGSGCGGNVKITSFTPL